MAGHAEPLTHATYQPARARRGRQRADSLPLVRPASPRSIGLPARAQRVRGVPQGAGRGDERVGARGWWRDLLRLRVAPALRGAPDGPRAQVFALSPGERSRLGFASAARRAAHRRARPAPSRFPPVRPRPRYLDHAPHGRAAHAPTSRSRFVKPEDVSEKITSLAKRRGFVFPSSEIYGGAGATWDFGPLGVELKRNVKDAWWRTMVQLREDIVGLDGAILMHPRVWEASGHVENFTDPLVECRNCRKRFRLDDLPKGEELAAAWRAKKLDLSGVPCPNCGERKLADPRQFNLMFKTFVGPVEDTASIAWLRPETAQSIFVDFENIQQTTRKKLPFGIAQIGKAFRNEITPGNFIFRSREFEQMEMQYFTRPSDAPRFYDEWKETRLAWHVEQGIPREKMRFRDHADDERAHYAAAATDIQFAFPFGWNEFEGIHYRTDYDLRRHSEL